MAHTAKKPSVLGVYVSMFTCLFKAEVEEQMNRGCCNGCCEKEEKGGVAVDLQTIQVLGTSQAGLIHQSRIQKEGSRVWIQESWVMDPKGWI